ncbi:dUTP diphosphatase [Parasaccharibacter apium]|uniref:Deoxyuridine 5'-triphosphate nucleotidohydrolase n=1 Tax=Parasaccharibacter apium TaxID=1510841 RepID=A0ABX4ZMY3_9PROT|nr:dUTP diphosphatase [Parasaccharibacter apium]POS62620.1 dUTP diphosphatase [Parasaccharibacter apium]POS63717.1 dUTP diphosphatase [Parasaccharibacter apium]POS63860.1 dUTP diphosphatase [Parasaccharibacter apium]
MSDVVKVRILRLPHSEGLELPAYGTAGAAGVDFQAAVQEPLILRPGERKLVPTGLCVALPEGHELQIRPRSGLALKHGIMVPNSPGTIDEDYRGEIRIILINAGAEDFVIERGMRVAQGVLAPVVRMQWQECSSLDTTDRGHGGFGSTGH